MKRRDDEWVSLLVVTGATLLVAFGLIALVGSNLMVAASSFLRGIFGSSYAMSEVLVRATPLMLAALGVSIGFKTGFTNLGAEGQLYMGAIAITATALVFPGLPPIVMIPLVILVGFAAGGAWALIPGFLKARFSISEVIMTIMLNYVAINLVGILVRTSLKDPAYPYPMSPILPESANFMQMLPPTRIHAGLVMALLMVIAVHLLVFRSRLGFGQSGSTEGLVFVVVYRSTVPQSSRLLLEEVSPGLPESVRLRVCTIGSSRESVLDLAMSPLLSHCWERTIRSVSCSLRSGLPPCKSGPWQCNARQGCPLPLPPLSWEP